MSRNQLIDSLELIVAGLMRIPIPPILILFSVIGFVMGVFLVTRPSRAIDLQRRFYAKINWDIRPISMEKEIRNTQIMGYFLIILAVVTLFLALTKNPLFI